jgi:cytochrome c553
MKVLAEYRCKQILLATLLAVALPFGSAQASGGHRVVATNPTWKAECGTCHIAYPANLLSAESWKAVMNGLEKHFGSDATVDSATRNVIMDFLEKNASNRRRDAAVDSTGKPQLRISETPWFKREHDEVPARTWKNPLVKSASNCAACHTQAESGDFNEHNIKMPR